MMPTTNASPVSCAPCERRIEPGQGAVVRYLWLTPGVKFRFLLENDTGRRRNLPDPLRRSSVKGVPFIRTRRLLSSRGSDRSRILCVWR